MSNIIKICVTAQDIDAAIPNGIDSPVTRALQRAVGEDWYAFETKLAYEMAPPYRCMALPEEALDALRDWNNSGVIRPFEFEIKTRL